MEGTLTAKRRREAESLLGAVNRDTGEMRGRDGTTLTVEWRRTESRYEGMRRLANERESGGVEKLTEAFGESYQQVFRTAMDNQQRNVQLAQGWVEGLSSVLESQAETNRALTRAMEAHTHVVEETVRSQERTSRALVESLEAYRDVLERSTEMQERSTQLVESLFGNVTGELRGQMEGSQEMVKAMMQGSERQMNAFQQMLGEAMNSYADLMSAPMALYQKNLEAMGMAPKKSSE